MQWKRWILGDWQLKMAGLAIALVLWAYVRTEQTMHLTLNVPLELRNPPRAMRFARRPPARIEVRLAAHRDIVSSLDPNKISAVVDLSNLKGKSSLTITLTRDNIRRPDGVEVLSIMPGLLTFKFEPAASSTKARKGR